MSSAASKFLGQSAGGYAMPLSGRARRLLACDESRTSEPNQPSDPASSAIPSETVRLSVADALLRGETHYTDRPGLLALRVAIAEKLIERFAMQVDAEADMVVTCGVTEARFVALQQLLGPDAILVAPLHGERVEGAALLRRAHLVTVAVTNATALYLVSSMAEPECRAAIAAAPANASIVYEIERDANAFHPAKIAGCAARTTTIGELGSDGWRIGYLVSPRAASPGMRDFKLALTICSSSLSQWAMLAALKAGEVAL